MAVIICVIIVIIITYVIESPFRFNYCLQFYQIGFTTTIATTNQVEINTIGLKQNVPHKYNRINDACLHEMVLKLFCM